MTMQATITWDHATIAADLGRRIEQGEFAPGQPLPDIFELQQDYGVRLPGVVRAAQQLLAMRGLVDVTRRRTLVVRAKSSRPRFLASTH
ncbi:GntR family transcriptional regulator [Calidifontibacter terrae]